MGLIVLFVFFEDCEWGICVWFDVYGDEIWV